MTETAWLSGPLLEVEMLSRLLRRDRRQQPTAPPAAVAVGTLPCFRTGCVADTAVACGYVDRLGQPCGTAWCGDHSAVLDGEILCRRHAPVHLVETAAGGSPIPGIDSRAPSLLQWVTAEVGDRIVTLLAGVDPSMTVLADPPRLAFIGRDRAHAWERSWKLGDHTGVHVWVALAVEEAHDDAVVVRVNGAEVDRVVPPWIDARRRREYLAMAEHEARRRAFYGRVLSVIGREVRMEFMEHGQRN